MKTPLHHIILSKCTLICYTYASILSPYSLTIYSLDAVPSLSVHTSKIALLKDQSFRPSIRFRDPISKTIRTDHLRNLDDDDDDNSNKRLLRRETLTTNCRHRAERRRVKGPDALSYRKAIKLCEVQNALTT